MSVLYTCLCLSFAMIMLLHFCFVWSDKPNKDAVHNNNYNKDLMSWAQWNCAYSYIDSRFAHDTWYSDCLISVHLQFLDHLLTGIEDICGHYGHHHWKDKYGVCSRCKNKEWHYWTTYTTTLFSPAAPSSAQTQPLQQEVCEEVPDRRRALQGAAAHRLLPQDGDETGHRDGGERRRSQAALCYSFHRLHAVSPEQTLWSCLNLSV